MTPARTDRAQLVHAYADGTKFEARRILYAHVRPRHDVGAWALGHLDLAPAARVRRERVSVDDSGHGFGSPRAASTNVDAWKVNSSE